MKPRDRALRALQLKPAIDEIPTWEMAFSPVEELLGESFPTLEQWQSDSILEHERISIHTANLLIKIAERLDYSLIRLFHNLPRFEDELIMIKHIKRETGDKFLVSSNSDGTLAIPTGDDMVQMSYDVMDQPKEFRERLERDCEEAIERGRRLIDAGMDIIDMISDYSSNTGPFLSPKVFSQLVTPYLFRQIQAWHKAGAFTIKHSDGNIMPIIDQIVECGPTALHSLDPMAGVDIAEVRRLYGDKICLMGNVNCAYLQTGPKEKIRESALYCLESCWDCGYIFNSSNSIFKGIPLDNYMVMLDTKKEFEQTRLKTLQKQLHVSKA